MRLLPTLTSRLVMTAVALVAVVCVLIATTTTLGIRSNLMSRLDDDLATLSHRPGGGFGPDGQLNVTPGTLIAIIPANGQASGFVGTFDRSAPDALGSGALGAVADVPVGSTPHTAHVPGEGSYRVIAQSGTTASGASVTVVLGMPTREVDATIENLVWWEAALTLLGVVGAGMAGTVVVRRQLRPLNEVARTAHAVALQPLDAGEIAISERVPAHLTDPRTEAGQVGAALNTLLEHVESSLDARHRSEQQVRQFVADASHELRTPLTTIAGYTQLARQHPEAVDVALGKVDEESRRMTALVEDLLLLARLDSGRPLERAPVDLSRMLAAAVDDVRVVDPEHDWRLELPDDPLVVVGDAGRLHQVVTNLLTNARKYTPAGTTVITRALSDGFEVQDGGPGIPPDLARVAFQRFTRGDAGRQRAGGVGLGLALVDAIVRAHGGTVRLASVPGDTRFEVRLPRAASS
ncbi:HAMP domain-containing sensor histidine kinase [Nocardioides maradonensis]